VICSHSLLNISVQQDSLQVKHMQRIPQLGLPEDRKKDSEKQTEQVNEVSDVWN
jgi:hypothetical protein